jgi:acyl carrier protein
MNEEFKKIVNYVFTEEELSEPEYDKSLTENGLDSLGVMSFIMFLHENNAHIPHTAFDDLDLTKITLNEIGDIFNASIN